MKNKDINHEFYEILKPKDLRIGNLVHHYDEIITVDGIDDVDIFSKNCGEIPLHEIKPVRLTEDCLVKFGFTTDDLGEDFTPEEYQYPIYRKGMVKIEYNRNGGYFKSENLVSIDLIEYNFVHELQNLYYFLTGDDLKWKI